MLFGVCVCVCSGGEMDGFRKIGAGDCDVCFCLEKSIEHAAANGLSRVRGTASCGAFD